MSYDIHAYAEFFPLREGPELDQLAERIKKHGQREPIVLLEGKILDGRRRELACEKAGVTPEYREFGARTGDGVDPLEFVIDANLNRRHLNEGERALAAARYATARGGKPPQNAEVKPVTNATAAARFETSAAKVERAKTVIKHGTEQLQAAVMEDRVSISDAAKVAKKPAEIQNRAVADVEAGRTATAQQSVEQQTVFCAKCTREGAEPDCGMCERARKRAKRKNKEKKPPKLTEYKDEFGNPVPKPLLDTWCDPWLSDTLDFLLDLNEELRMKRIQDGIDKRKTKLAFIRSADLKGAIDIAVDALDKAIDHLNECKPSGVCPKCGGDKCNECRGTGLVPAILYQKLKQSKENTA